MLTSITVLISEHEKAALQELAAQHMRPPAHELRYLLVQAAKRRGLLPASQDTTSSETSSQGRRQDASA